MIEPFPMAPPPSAQRALSTLFSRATATYCNPVLSPRAPPGMYALYPSAQVSGLTQGQGHVLRESSPSAGGAQGRLTSAQGV